VQFTGKARWHQSRAAAIDPYEAAKSGKPVAIGQTRARLTSRGRRASKRNAILKLIQEAEGLTRGEILDRVGLKGDKAGEMSVSNALTALTKGNQVVRVDGRYRAA
jgi:Fe2+ or Zn2+ uptake regulation protein